METVEVNSFEQVDIEQMIFPLVVVYNGPADYPGKYVARLFDCNVPTNTVIVKDTLKEVRKDIMKNFPYMIRIKRSAEELKCIVETWM